MRGFTSWIFWLLLFGGVIWLSVTAANMERAAKDTVNERLDGLENRMTALELADE